MKYISRVFFIASLLLASASFAQTELQSVQAKLSSYTKTHLPEKVFLHTDKNFYATGEIVWFKLYAVDGIFNKPLEAAKVAYVEVLDRNNTPVSRAKIPLNEKGGNGSVLLPLSLRSGYYTIRAYTNWMKNMGADQFFEKQITIVNPLKTPDVQEEKNAAENSLQIFPEGGNLVNGLSSKIAFHLIEKNGKGVPAKGYLLNSNNDTLSSFEPYKFGMGHFELTPQAGNNYKVIFVLNDGSTVSQVVPHSFETGYTMQLEEVAGDKIQVTVKTNIRSGNPEVFLLAQTRQIAKLAQKAFLSNGLAVFTINKKNLDQGVSQFTVFDGEQKPVCERLFFIQPTLKEDLKLQASKGSYTTRDKVDLSINTSASSEANMSLSVYLLDDLETNELVNIDEYFWLTSELSGTVENPAFYFTSLNEEVRKATDYLMLTHGWRRFKWETALSPSLSVKFQRERFGHLVTGRVTDVRTNAIAKDVQVFLSVPNSPQKLFTAVSDSTGLVSFDVKEYFGDGEVIVQTHPKDSFYKVEILSPFSETYTSKAFPSFSFSTSQRSPLLTRSIGMQAQHIYNPDSLSRFYMPAITDSFPFYGRALYSYRLDDYRRFNTMEEVLREYVREINVGVKGSGTSLRFKLFNETYREIYQDDLLVMVDGIPLSDPNKVFSMDPLKIKKLDVINRNYVFGNAIFHGLANFSSYTGLYEGLDLDKRAVTIDYEGLQLQREFYSPDYSSDLRRSGRIPDLRTTLLWMPDVKTKEISFYIGDNKGRYMVVLQGIDGNGQAVSATSQIEVK